MPLMTKDGRLVKGTLETVEGYASIAGIHRDDTGALQIDHSGHTEFFWDGMLTQTDPGSGQILFLTEDGQSVTEAELDDTTFYPLADAD